MYHVCRVVCHPSLRLPCNIRSKTSKGSFVWESRDINLITYGRHEQLSKFYAALGINRTVGSDGLNKHKPFLVGKPQNDIGHLAVFLD